MYLITWENNADGTWLDDPDGFDSEQQAREHAAKYPARTGAYVAIYRCDLIDTIEGATLPSPENSP